MVLIMACGLLQDRILSTRGKRWMEHVANMRGDVYNLWWEKVRESNNLQDIGADGRIIIKWFSKEWSGNVE
jgi:hypothetical protein